MSFVRPRSDGREPIWSVHFRMEEPPVVGCSPKRRAQAALPSSYLDGGSCSSPSMLLIFELAIGPEPSFPGWSGIVTANSPTLFS